MICNLFLAFGCFQTSSIEKAKTLPIDNHTYEGFLLVLVFFICFGVTIALLMLGSWNMYLIGRAETAIEFYTNQRDYRDMKRQGKVGFEVT